MSKDYKVTIKQNQFLAKIKALFNIQKLHKVSANVRIATDYTSLDTTNIHIPFGKRTINLPSVWSSLEDKLCPEGGFEIYSSGSPYCSISKQLSPVYYQFQLFNHTFEVGKWFIRHLGKANNNG